MFATKGHCNATWGGSGVAFGQAGWPESEVGSGNSQSSIGSGVINHRFGMEGI